MKKYAVIEGNNILNTIVSESQEVAENITGKTCVEFTEELAEPGGTYENGIFIPRKPFDSWVLNASNSWEAPVPYPLDDKSYFWNEEIRNWEEVPVEEEVVEE